MIKSLYQQSYLFSGEKAVVLEKSRQSRLHLRKFLKAAKLGNPDLTCSLGSQELVIDGRVFVYSEAAGRVVNKNIDNIENSDEISQMESERDR